MKDIEVNEELILKMNIKEDLKQKAIFKLDVCPTCGSKLLHYTNELAPVYSYEVGILWWKKVVNYSNNSDKYKMCCSKDKSHLDITDQIKCNYIQDTDDMDDDMLH